jgi:hypothetical protein
MLLIVATDDFDDLSVIHARDSIGKFENPRIVSDHDERSVGSPGYTSQELHHAAAGHVIEVACRLVANDQLRFMYQRARNRHALLLATAELPRKRVKARAETNGFEYLFRTGLRVLASDAVNQ